MVFTIIGYTLQDTTYIDSALDLEPEAQRYLESTTLSAIALLDLL